MSDPLHMMPGILIALAVLGGGAVSEELEFEGFPFGIPYEGLAEGTAPAALARIAAPAGQEGFVQVAGDRFVLSGSGRALRFWGTHLCGAACFPPHEVAERMAGRMASLGFNCVRFHNMDGAGYPRGIWEIESWGDFEHTTFHAEALDRLDYLIAQLKEHGIYSNLNLHVGRVYGQKDGFPPVGEGQTMPRYGKALDMYYPQCIEEQKRYARMLLRHVNAYTGHAYAEEPAVAMVEINNEDGLLWQWLGGGLDTVPQPYLDELGRQWNQWLRRRYASTEDLRKAWSEGESPGGPQGLSQGEGLEQGVGCPMRRDLFNRTDAYRMDVVRFLRETEAAYWRGMCDFLHEELGVKMPVGGTDVHRVTPHVAAETTDFLDTHAYWEHPRFPGRSWDRDNWIVRNRAMVNDPRNSSIAAIAGRRVFGLPYTLTEYNHPSPNRYEGEGWPLMALYGSFQAWDGIFTFAYCHGTTWETDCFTGFFDINGHPVKLAVQPVCSHLLRSGAVPPPGRVVSGRLTLEERLRLLLYGRAQPQAAEADPDADTEGGPEAVNLYEAGIDRLAWQDALAGIVTDGEGPAAPSGADSEVRWEVGDDGRGLVTYTARTCAGLIGFCADRTLAAGPVTITPGTTSLDGFAAVLLNSVDGQDIGQDGRYLVTAVTRCANQGMIRNEEGDSVGRNWGRGPTLCEGVPLVLTFRGDGRTLKLFSLNPDGTRREDVPGEALQDGTTAFKLGPRYRTLWYELSVGG